MKTKTKTKKRKPIPKNTKPFKLSGSRQVVESAIDATKSFRNQTWDELTSDTRNHRFSRETFYEET